MRRSLLLLFSLSRKGLLPFLCLFALLLTSGCGLFSRAADDQQMPENDTALFGGDPVPYTVTFRIIHQNGQQRDAGDAPARMAGQTTAKIGDGATDATANTSSGTSASETASTSVSSTPSETPSDSASKTSSKNSASEKNSAPEGAAPSEPNLATDVTADVTDAELLSLMRSNSMLEQLLAQPPDSMLGLERRARSDRDVALKAMHSLGFYDGRVRFHLDKDSSPVKVLFDLLPG